MTYPSDHGPDMFTTAVVELIAHLQFVSADRLARSLELVHDLALYHTNVPIATAEKHALHDMKVLMEYLDRVSGEAQDD